MWPELIAFEQQFIIFHDILGSWIQAWHSMGVLSLFHSVATSGEITWVVESWNIWGLAKHLFSFSLHMANIGFLGLEWLQGIWSCYKAAEISQRWRWKHPVLLKARPGSGVESLSPTLLFKAVTGQPRFKGKRNRSCLLMAEMSKNCGLF